MRNAMIGVIVFLIFFCTILSFCLFFYSSVVNSDYIETDNQRHQFIRVKAATSDEYLLAITVAENLFDIRCSQVLKVDARQVLQR